MLVPAIALFLVAPTKPAPAAGDCMSYCLQAPGAGGASNCATRCSPGGDLDVTHPWKRTISYGAIAYGAKSNAFGYAFDKDSDGAAKQTAMAECKKSNDDCEIVASFSNSCAAVAAVEAKGAYAVGKGGTRASAQSRAMSACAKKNGAGRQIETWTCAQP